MSDADIQLLLGSLTQEDASTSREALATLSILLPLKQEAQKAFLDQNGAEVILRILYCSTDSSVTEGCLYALVTAISSVAKVKDTLRTDAVFSRLHQILSSPRATKEPLVTKFCAALVMDLAADNVPSQTLARQTCCFHDLLQLFYDLSGQILPKSIEAWVTICQAISSCLNNPQNLQNQYEAASIIPEAIRLMDTWIHKADLHQSRLNSLTILILNVLADNPGNQEKFAEAGGIESSARCILMKVPMVLDKNLVLLLGVVLQGNPTTVKLLQPFNLIPFLLMRLHEIDDEGKSVYLLTISHMVGASEEQQQIFLKAGGESRVRWETAHKDAKSHLRHVADCLIKICNKSNESSAESHLNTLSRNGFFPAPVQQSEPTSFPIGNSLNPYANSFPMSNAIFPSSNSLFMHPLKEKGNSAAGDSGIDSNSTLMPPPPPPPPPAKKCPSPAPPPLASPVLSNFTLPSTPNSTDSFRSGDTSESTPVKVPPYFPPNTFAAVLQPRTRNPSGNANQPANSSQCSRNAAQFRLDLENSKPVAVFQASTFVSVLYRREKDEEECSFPLLDEARGKARFLQEWLQHLQVPGLEEARRMRDEEDAFLKRVREEAAREMGEDVVDETSREVPPSQQNGLGYPQQNMENVSMRGSEEQTSRASSKRKRRVEYTEEEVRNIVEGVKRFGPNFKDIRRSYKFHPSRTAVSLYDKWRHSIKPRSDSGSRSIARSFILA